MTTKTVKIITDEITDEISRLFDYDFDGTSSFQVPEIGMSDQAHISGEYSIAMIVGPSGSGKSSLLEQFGKEENLDWDQDKSVASHFESADDAIDRLGAVGFNSVPSWMRPYHVLSNGEQFRADLARKLKDGAVIDEFTSVVDRNVAKSCAMALRKYVDKKGLKNLTFASCHYDIIEWLQPDWVYDTVTQEVLPRGSLQQPKIEVELIPCSINAWEMFRDHHYLTGEINKSARCWIAVWGNTPVGFAS
jgi:GTPase SAR1 family protein